MGELREIPEVKRSLPEGNGGLWVGAEGLKFRHDFSTPCSTRAP